MRNIMITNTQRGWAYRYVSVLHKAKREETKGNNYCIRKERPR